MTSRSVLDRFIQIEPKVLFASCGYWYGGKNHDRRAVVEEIVAGLPTLQHLVLVSNAVELGRQSPSVPAKVLCHRWEDLLASARKSPSFFSSPFRSSIRSGFSIPRERRAGPRRLSTATAVFFSST